MTTDSYNERGNALADQRRFAEAVSAYQEAIWLRPDFAEAHANLGHVLAEVHLFDDAIAAYRQAVHFAPTFGPFRADLANLLRRLNRLDEATHVLDEADRAAAPCPELFYARHLLHQHQGQWNAAQADLQSAIVRWPDHAQSHVSLALHLLLRGDFDRGWHEYEWRWRTPLRQSDVRHFSLPQWDGTAGHGRCLLLHCEQGLGTTFQFIRYAPLLAKQGYAVAVECQPAVARILQCLSPEVIVIPTGHTLPPFDAHIPLLSVPRVMRTTANTIPAGNPYLRPEVELAEHCRTELARLNGLKIGIAWQGNPFYALDKDRSIPLRCFAPLADVPGVSFVCLQQRHGLEQLPSSPLPLFKPDWRHLGPHEAFVDTAAIIANLDLVITSDTSIAHLAGALGVKVWVALPFMADWRWLLDREDSPWYPTMRLFRQKTPRDWAEVFQRIAAELHMHIGIVGGTMD